MKKTKIKQNDWARTLVEKTYIFEGVKILIPKNKEYRIWYLKKNKIVLLVKVDNFKTIDVEYKLSEVKHLKGLRRFELGDWVITTKPIPLYNSVGTKIIGYLPVSTSADICEPYNDKESMLEVPALVGTNYDCLVDCSNDCIELCNDQMYEKLFKIGDKVRAISYIPKEALPLWFSYDSVGTIKEIIDYDTVLIEYIINGQKRYLGYSIYRIVHDNKVFKQSDYFNKCEKKRKLS